MTAVGGLRKRVAAKKKSEAVRGPGRPGFGREAWRRTTTSEMNKDIQNLVQLRPWRPPHLVPPIKMEKDQHSELGWHDSIFATNNRDAKDLAASRHESVDEQLKQRIADETQARKRAVANQKQYLAESTGSVVEQLDTVSAVPGLSKSRKLSRRSELQNF